MEEQEASDYLFLVANQSARNAGRSLKPNAEAFLRDMTAKAGHVIGQLNDPGVQDIQLRQAESDIKRFIEFAVDAAKTIPNYTADLLGEQTMGVAQIRFCPCPPFC